MRTHTCSTVQRQCLGPQNTGFVVVAARAGLGLLAMLLSLSSGDLRLIAQEPIQGGPARDAREPAQAGGPGVKPPTLNPFVQESPTAATPAADSLLPAADPLQDYRHALEEHVLRQEQAKAEARSRFESRSLDLVPKLMPTQPTPTATAEEQAAAAQFDRVVDQLPPPGQGDDKTGKQSSIAAQEEIRSPSDRPSSRDSGHDDLLLPETPAERDLLAEPERKSAAPLQPNGDSSSERPSRLGGDSPAASQPPALPKANPTARDSTAAEKSTPSKADRDHKQAQSVLETSLDPLAPKANHWTGLIEDERDRWSAPASHRPYQPTNQVTCSGCGGCVDRHGVGFYDKLGVRMGVGTREHPACQCWRSPHAAPFHLYGPGGYAGPSRSTPLPEYRLRAGDQVQLTFLIKTVRTVGSYRLVVGDELLIESDADANLTRGTLDRGLEIQPDGTLTLRFIGQVHAAGQTIEQLRDLLNDRYEEYYPDPAIDVTPVRTGNVARQIREAISGSEGFNPQQTLQTVTPEGTLRLPRLGAIPTQGLTMGELKREINLRYESLGAGLEVEVTLDQQAPHYVYVLGEVATPGRFVIDAPTTVLGSLSLAGSYVPGANLRQVVVFRRGPNWELLSTVLDLRAALLGHASQPSDEIWVQDGDVIIVPPAPIRLFDRFVQQVFTEGIYGIVPFGGVSFSLGSNNR